MLKELLWHWAENKCSHQWTRQPSPFRRDSCMNVMLSLKCCVLWSHRQNVLTRVSKCKKLIYSLILLGCAHLRFKRIGVAFHKPTSTHFTHSAHEEYDTTAACSHWWGFYHELWDFLPALQKNLPEIVNLTKNIRWCLWQNSSVFALKSNIQSSIYLKLTTTQMGHNKVTVFECAAFSRRKMNLWTPPQQPIPQICIILSCTAVLHISLYSQVLCGQVSCWNTEIGHLLRDTTVWLPGSSGIQLSAFNNEWVFTIMHAHQSCRLLLVVNVCSAVMLKISKRI